MYGNLLGRPSSLALVLTKSLDNFQDFAGLEL